MPHIVFDTEDFAFLENYARWKTEHFQAIDAYNFLVRHIRANFDIYVIFKPKGLRILRRTTKHILKGLI